MSDNNIKSEIINFYNDPLYQELNAYYSKKTIFNILKIERNENRHSAFLAWLLNVNVNHQLGDEPIKKFMRLLAMKDDKYIDPFLVGKYQIENMEVETERCTDVKKNNKPRRVDVDIEFSYTLDKDKKDDEPKYVHVILENKVYTKEYEDQTDDYYKWAARENKESNKNKSVIGVFLSPELTEKCAGDSDKFKYIKITYDDILKFVFEPLLSLEMPNETRALLTDYVINLGQPVRSKDDDENEKGNEDTILAVSNSNKTCFIEIYDNHRTLLDASLYVVNCNKKEQLKIAFGGKELDKAFLENNKTLLNDFWEANKRMLRMIFDTALKLDTNMYKYLKEGADEADESKYKDAVDVLLNLKKSNRDTTKYLVYAIKEGGSKVPMNDMRGEKPVPVFMSIASFFIFKAWVIKNDGASLNEIRKAFSVDACAKHYSNTYQYLFYKKEDVESAIKNDTDGHDYVVAEMDENDQKTMDKHKFLKWDFFIGENAQKYCLHLNGTEVLSVKMWHKEEFIELAKFAKENYGIEVVAKGK